ncbi:MAG TPA: mechanosensitive ion channel family protein [Thermoanaerobaculia bacterium]|nr:mechanosensitive ion channel family protein [Thermoanaerobaculia bacterium]
MRSTDRSRFFFPILSSIALFAIYTILRHDPRLLPRLGDLRDVFGKDLALLRFAAYIPLILLVVRFFDLVVFDLAMARRRGVSAPPLLRDVIALILYLLLFGSLFTTIFNYDLRTLLGGGALLAAVLGLALQDTLGNLISGIAMHMEDSFEVGDVIRSGEFIGRVEDVSWRATKIRTYNNDVVMLPNSLLARERLEVFPSNNPNARTLEVGIDYHFTPAMVIDVLQRAASHVEGVDREMPCFARVAGFGDSAVTYEIKYFMRDYMLRDRIDADIRKAVWYAMRRNEIAIPFPVRAYHAYTPPAADHQTKISRDELLARLRDVDILTPLSDSALQSIADSAEVHVYSKGETLIRHGTAGESMFVIDGGSVSVRIPDDSSPGVNEVAQLGEGDVVGEMALLTGETRTADVLALTDVVAIEIGKSALHPLLVAHPELADALSEQIAQRLEDLETFREESPEQVQTTVLSRIRDWFGL